MDAIEHYDAVDVFIGVDVGKGEHHAVALSRVGKRLFDKALEGRCWQSDAKLQLHFSSSKLPCVVTWLTWQHHEGDWAACWPDRSRADCAAGGGS